MAIKFEKIQPGMVLLDIRTEQAGNTTMRRIGVWDVRVISVNAEKRTAVVSWNGNREKTMYARDLQKLYARVPPKMQARIDAQKKIWGW